MDMTVEDMERFHGILNKYLLDNFKIQFDKLTLRNIVLPTLSATSQGVVSYSLSNVYLKLHAYTSINLY